MHRYVCLCAFSGWGVGKDCIYLYGDQVKFIPTVVHAEIYKKKIATVHIYCVLNATIASYMYVF